MADKSKATDGPAPDDNSAWDFGKIPDGNLQFVSEADIDAFAAALSAPDLEPMGDDASIIISNGAEKEDKWPFGLERQDTNQSIAGPTGRERPGVNREESTLTQRLGLRREETKDSKKEGDRQRERNQAMHRRGSAGSMFISSKNDWAPVHERVKKRRPEKEVEEKKKPGKLEKLKRGRRKVMRTKDETREGYLYTLLKWPLLLLVGTWLLGLSFIYGWTRLYIWSYEYFVSTRGRRHKIGKKMEDAQHYKDWVEAAKEMDEFLGNDKWKEEDEFAYYDHKTIRRVLESLRKQRRRTEAEEKYGQEGSGKYQSRPVEELKSLVQACVKNNFVGVESSRLYSQTYYGTKNLVQEFIDEGKTTPRSFLSIHLTNIPQLSAELRLW